MSCGDSEPHSTKCGKRQQCESGKPYQRQRLLSGNCVSGNGPLIPVYSDYDSGDHKLIRQGHIQEKDVTSSVPHPDRLSPSIGDNLVHCPLCENIIIEAMVSRCGHTFCHECIHKSLKVKPGCPKCSLRFEGIHVDCIDDIIQKNLCHLDPEFVKRWKVAKKARKIRSCKKQKRLFRHVDGALLYIDHHLLKLQFLGFAGVCGKIFSIFTHAVPKRRKQLNIMIGIFSLVVLLTLFSLWTEWFQPLKMWKYVKGWYEHQRNFEYADSDDGLDALPLHSEKLPETEGYHGNATKKCDSGFNVYRLILNTLGLCD